MPDYRPCFSDVDDDWRKRWEMLRNFIRTWYSVKPFPEKGRAHYLIPDEFPERLFPVETWGPNVETIEEKLAVRLPPSLREWHSLFSQTSSNFYNLLRDDHWMEWSDNGNMLVFRVISEGNVAWGIRKTDLQEDDPVVYEMDVLKYGDQVDTWFGTTWTESGSTRLRVSEWLVRNFQWYLRAEEKISLRLPEEKALRAERLKQIQSGFQRQSNFGPFLILESTNCFAAYQADSAAKKLVLFFAKKIDFSNLPDWIIENTDDHRIVNRPEIDDTGDIQTTKPERPDSHWDSEQESD